MRSTARATPSTRIVLRMGRHFLQCCSDALWSKLLSQSLERGIDILADCCVALWKHRYTHISFGLKQSGPRGRGKVPRASATDSPRLLKKIEIKVSWVDHLNSTHDILYGKDLEGMARRGSTKKSCSRSDVEKVEIFCESWFFSFCHE